ncbi:MAG TPA: AEC family transporter [Anaerolineales bacterium]|nr:AEC family transporter [Anaerolineales bacterium]
MESLFSLFSENLFPVFLAAGAGYALAFFSPLETRSVSRIAFYIFSPCLVFILLTDNQLGNGALLGMFAYATTQMVLTAALAWVASRLFGFGRRITVAIVLAGLLPNAGNFGLSVTHFAFGEAGLAQASLFFIASGVMANTLGVYLAALGNSDYRTALLGLFKLPTIYAVILAAVFLRFGWELPTPVARAAHVLADAAIPTMLVLLGMLLHRTRWHGNWAGLATANAVRLLAGPAIALLLAVPFGLTGVARQAGVLEAAMPAAVMTTVLASEFEVEPEFMTAVVFSSTLLSPLTLTPLLAYLTASG